MKPLLLVGALCALLAAAVASASAASTHVLRTRPVTHASDLRVEVVAGADDHGHAAPWLVLQRRTSARGHAAWVDVRRLIVPNERIRAGARLMGLGAGANSTGELHVHVVWQEHPHDGPMTYVYEGTPDALRYDHLHVVALCG